jgi:hypothetical protein
MRRRELACRRHVVGLTALAARREPIPHRTALFAHLERCDACAEQLQELMLTVIALRRIGEVPGAAGLAPSAWPRLRQRIERSRAGAAAIAWRWRTTLAGLATGAMVVAALVGPMALHLPVGGSGAEPTGYGPRRIEALGSQIEHAYLVDARAGRLTPLTSTEESLPGVPRRYPDGIAPVGKEVDSRPSGHPPTVE